jgi:UDP-N-acetyl-D-mannosaminuronic acid dehydrogenase
MKKEIIRKIKNKDVVVTVVGLGYVGLPTAAIFANRGLQVIGVDINKKVIEAVSSGSILIQESGLSQIVRNVIAEGKMKATTETFHAIKEADVIIVCVQTPLNENGKPDLTCLENACKNIAKELSNGKLVIIESTVPPGTTKDFVAPILEDGSGLRCGTDFWLAFCPERVMPGKVLQEFIENPRIVGGYNQDSTEIAVELLKGVVNGKILTTDCTTAEAAKLAENTFRDINISFANELAMICEAIGLDVIEVIKLANTHTRVNIHKPGCGVGGTCIPKDPYLLLHPIDVFYSQPDMIRPSREINDHMPKHTVSLVLKALKSVGKDGDGSKVAILGVTYKGDVSSLRNSPAKEIIHDLMNLGTEVVVYDPLSKETFTARRAESIPEAVKGADCIVITTDHTAFKELDIGEVKVLMNDKPTIVDGRRIVDPNKAKKHGFMYYGVGYGVS